MIPRLLVISFALFLTGCGKPSVEPTPEAYLVATQIWSSESRAEELELKVDKLVAKISVTGATSSGTTIQFPDEHEPRDIFPLELYFGASEIKYDDKAGVIYIKVAGSNPLSSSHGTRIFEYDARRRSPLRDYWVEVEVLK